MPSKEPRRRLDPTRKPPAPPNASDMKTAVFFLALASIGVGAARAQPAPPADSTAAPTAVAPAPTPQNGGRDVFDFRGYVKYLQTTNFAPYTDIYTENLIHNRLDFRLYPTESFTVAVEVRNRLWYGTGAMPVPGDRAERMLHYDGVLPLETNWTDREDLIFNTIVDRAWIDYAAGDFEFRAGRQRINYGLNTVWNPNDWFNTFNYLDFDYEERPGSDAVRVQYFPTAMSSVEVAYKWGETRDDDVFAAKYKFNTQGYDVQFLAGRYRRDAALGLGWAGGVGGAGFKTEVSAFTPYEAPAMVRTEVSLATQLDYSFRNGVYILGSYLFNTAGSSMPRPLGDFYRELPSPKRLMPSRHTAFAMAQYAFSPVFSAQFATMYGFGLNWLILYPTLTYGIRENWDIDLVAQVFANEDPLTGDFENAGNALFLRLKWSF